MIELFETGLITDGRRSSKGNQLKWENDGVYYKADFTGYEGLSEYVVSMLLRKTTLAETEYVLYEPEEIRYKSTVYRGAKSRNFLQKGWQLITLERLYGNYYGRSLTEEIGHIPAEEDRLVFLVDNVERLTGIREFGAYMNKLLTIDAFFLNEDRHLHNVAVLMNAEQHYRLCPIFDHGAALLADTMMDYPMNADIYQMMNSVKAKTFSQDFDVQLEVSEKHYGRNIRLGFSRADVDRILASVTIYPDEIRERVRKILYDRIRKYGYLFAK